MGTAQLLRVVGDLEAGAELIGQPLDDELRDRVRADFRGSRVLVDLDAAAAELVGAEHALAYSRPRNGGIWAIQLDEDDELVGVGLSKPGDTILLGTATGKAIRFDEAAARAMGRQAHGVRGIKLLGDDRVVGMVVASDPEGTVFSACENGYGKRTPLEEYPVKNRGGQGVINIKATSRNGLVMGVALAADEDDVMFITKSGMIVRSPVADMRPMGRGTQGVRLINLKSEDQLVSTEIVRAADLAMAEEEDVTTATPPIVDAPGAVEADGPDDASAEAEDAPEDDA